MKFQKVPQVAQQHWAQISFVRISAKICFERHDGEHAMVKLVNDSVTRFAKILSFWQG